MIFRSTTLDSVFVSAVAAGALVAATTAATLATTTTTTTTTADNDVAFKDSVPKGNDGRLLWSGNSKNANDILLYGPSNIPDNRILLENNRSKEKTLATGRTHRLLRNNNNLMNNGVGVGGKPVDRNDTIDLGILDNNTVPADTTGELDRHRELSDLDAYCDLLCPSPRKKIPYGTNIASLQIFCRYGDNPDECGDCSGDGDDIDYRCPSQVKCWKTSAITDMRRAFSRTDRYFDDPLRCWDVSSVTDMSGMFYYATYFNLDISEWDVSSVTTMDSMFQYASYFNSPIDSWDVSSVTSMESMLQGLYSSEFNQSLESWDVSNVKTMKSMFRYAYVFNQPLESWDVSNVKTMNEMFYSASDFNLSLDSWDVSNVTSMKWMFYNADGFNQPLDSWDVSSVTSMESMFYNADGFNQPLDSWNVSSVKTMRRMFFETSNFYQCISSWAIKTTDDPESLDVSGMFKDSGCPYERDPDISRGPWCDVPGNSCFSCYDDPGFRFEGQDSKNCEWAASELIEQRCLKEGVSEGCPRTCNPVCSGTTCVNDPDFRLGGVKAKSCEWVAKRKTEERCKKPGVFAACPESCNPACATVVDCTDDQDFQLNGLKGKNCEWVAKQKTDERCNKTGVMASCRRTCNPKCGCKDSMDEFEFQGSTITCKDLDIINCDAEPEPKLSSDEFTLAQLMQLQELLNPIHQRLDAIEDAVVEEGNETPNEVETFRDLCPNKCKTCV